MPQNALLSQIICKNPEEVRPLLYHSFVSQIRCMRAQSISLLPFCPESIFEDGFPFPVADSQSPAASAGTPSSSRISSTAVVLKSFSLDDSLSLQQSTRPSLWQIHNASPGYSSEASLSIKYIQPALVEILSCFRDLEHMQIVESATLQPRDAQLITAGGCKADFWVVRDYQTNERYPFCAIEAKLPNNSSPFTWDLTNDMAGQMFDYLLVLRQNFGVRAPFGLITTYFTWWICWLPDCDAVAQEQAGKVRTDPIAKRELHGVKFDLPKPFEYISATQQDKDAVENFCRALASAVLKSVKCGFSEALTALPSYSMCYHKDRVTWKSLEGITKIVDEMPGPKNTNFFLLGYLGAGADGEARIVCDSKGHRCVMKRYHQKDDAKQVAEQECSMWSLINEVKASTRIVNKKVALLMPYLHPVSSDEFNDPAIQEQVIGVLLSCAAKNYLQSDAAWRHIGWYKKGHERKLMLFDFGHIKELDTHDAVTRQNKINAAVFEFCACQKRGLCKMCKYVKEHSEPPRAESKTRTSSRTTPAPSQLPTVRRTRSNTVLSPTPPQLPKSHARPRVAPKSPAQSGAAPKPVAKPSKKPPTSTATADQSAAHPKYKGAN